MKGYNESRTQAANTQAKLVIDELSLPQSERERTTTQENRSQKIARLKEEVRSGEYQADVHDIARLLTSAMDPVL